MTTKVQKWGNSLAVRIPRAFAEEARLEAGTEVDMKLADGGIVIAPAAKPKHSLDALLKQVNKGNIHEETDWGAPVGGEAW